MNHSHLAAAATDTRTAFGRRVTDPKHRHPPLTITTGRPNCGVCAHVQDRKTASQAAEVRA